MKKILIVTSIAILLIASIFALSGCSKKNKNESKNPIVGSWEYSGYIYTFNDDNTGSYTAFGNIMNFTYEDDGSKVKILYKGNTVPGTYEYKINDKKLIIKDSFGNDIIYEKK